MQNEDSNVEYKRELNKHLKREIVSFLNSNSGGIIYLGVDDGTKELLEIEDNIKHSWEEILSNWAINAFYPIPYGLIQVFPNEKPFRIMVKSGKNNRPFAIASKGFDSSGVYIREGSSAVRASNERVMRMQQQYIISGRFDSEVSEIQDLSFNYMKSIFEDLKIDYDINALQMKSHGQNDLFNNSALLLSDQNEQTSKAAVFDGLNVMRFRDKKEFYGSIADQIKQLFAYMDLINRKRIVIGHQIERIEQDDYPIEAVREAIVNGFVHRDYLLHSEVRVEVYDDRIEILSPGGIPDGLTIDDIERGQTAARNPHLIHILNKMDIIENYGTGIKRINSSYDKFDLKPSFVTTDNLFKVILPNLNYGFNFVQERSRNGKFNFDDDDVKIYRIIHLSDKPVKRNEIEHITGLSKSAVVKSLGLLQEMGIIEKYGSSVNTRYIGK